MSTMAYILLVGFDMQSLCSTSQEVMSSSWTLTWAGMTILQVCLKEAVLLKNRSQISARGSENSGWIPRPLLTQGNGADKMGFINVVERPQLELGLKRSKW